MENYVLSCCSTADLTKEHFTRRDIHYVCFHFSLDGRQYTDVLCESISYADFYAAMEREADTKADLKKIQSIGRRMFKNHGIELPRSLSEISYKNALSYFSQKGLGDVGAEDKIRYYNETLEDVIALIRD